jgi:hypothetical protein
MRASRSNYEDWLKLAIGLCNARDHIINITGANSDQDTRYQRAFAQWCEKRQWAAKWSGKNKKSFRSACYWLIENREQVEKWRVTLDESERMRWNNPETVKKRFLNAHPAKPVRAGDAPPVETPMQRLRRENDSLKSENEAMKRNGGSLFTLGKDGSRPIEIARIISENESSYRFEAIWRAMTAERNRRKDLSKHAG